MPGMRCVKGVEMLKEIEFRLDKYPLNRPDLYHHEVDLLIRAVRQLGEAAFDARDIDLSGVDPDVLALLEEGR